MKRFRVAIVSLILLLLSVVSAGAYSAYNPPVGWWALPDLAMFGGYGETTMENLVEVRQRWNTSRLLGGVFAGVPSVYITHDASLGGSILVTNETPSRMVVNANGDYLIYKANGDVPAQQADPSDPDYNKWVDGRAVSSEKIVLSYDALSELAKKINTTHGISCKITKNGSLYMITRNNNALVYCNLRSMPYVASATPSATDIDFNLIVENTVVDNSKVLDIDNNLMTVINENGEKISYNIDSLYYDSTTNTYTANTYQFNDYSNTYNYYTWNITYNIQNTYINYIGSNVGFEHDEYKYYYQLPDGRSSEDLTADEVSAMSFQFYDVKNYARSATDTSLRALYHFDGNTEDSGYFSTQTAFTWENNASITYMDSAGFNGALYLDERTHSFDIDLPSNLPSSSDFSIQWRHYQASQPDTDSNINNSLAIGGVTVLRWDEAKFYMGSSGTTGAASIPVGNWHELALVRHNGTLYFYVNGLKASSMADTTGYQGKLMFSYGTTSRAYTMLDELRVVNFAVAESGASYQCATVPYDTNLVLVLPDSAFPIADEYWDFRNDNAPVSSNFTLGTSPSGWVLGSNDTGNSPIYNDGYTTFVASASPGGTVTQYGLRYSLDTVFVKGTSKVPYYLSIIYADGTIETQSVLVTRNSSGQVTVDSSTFYFTGMRARFQMLGDSNQNPYLCLYGLEPVDILYVELAHEPITDYEYVQCLYSSEDIQPNTAAVQSSIPVSGYTVGGVRPTFPVRGDVWFPVSGSRITGCYIYDGSMWLTAGCRYYTGTRWIPIYAFDIYTLADCWDVADSVDVTPPITTEYDFWNWWKKEWLNFRSWLALTLTGQAIDPTAPGTNPGGDDDDLIPPIAGDGEEDEGFSISDLITGIIKALWKLVSGIFKVLLGGVVGFFNFVTDSINNFFDIFTGIDNPFDTSKYTNVSGPFELLRAIWDALPFVIRSLITSVVALFIFLGLFLAIKG